uniref:Major facilitator superfamily (MFS) profile domain-containing protein n=1 Tax=Megaselia scalaris TaxID=36166 RepID=T1GJV8_MEGSC
METAVDFERALEHADFGKFNIFLIIFSGFVMTNAHLETASIGYILPTSQCDMDWSIQQRGILSATGFFGMVISSYFWGVLSDTTGRRRTMRITLILGFICSIISSFSINFWMFFTMRLLNGICISGGGA